MGETAPKISSFTIPMDKIGEVIGPKGKVINTIQQETGAEIAVDDDGVVGTVTIGSPDGRKVAEARRQIELIVNPPTARPGEVYTGRVVNITKFGAFVNILPGRDGLVHISKLGKGSRINRVEDVLELGDDHRGARRRHRSERQGQPLADRRRLGGRWRWRRGSRSSGQRSSASDRRCGRAGSVRDERGRTELRGGLRIGGPRGLRRSRARR